MQLSKDMQKNELSVMSAARSIALANIIIFEKLKTDLIKYLKSLDDKQPTRRNVNKVNSFTKEAVIKVGTNTRTALDKFADQQIVANQELMVKHGLKEAEATDTNPLNFKMEGGFDVATVYGVLNEHETSILENMNSKAKIGLLGDDGSNTARNIVAIALIGAVIARAIQQNKTVVHVASARISSKIITSMWSKRKAVVGFQLINPNDDRTSPLCKLLHTGYFAEGKFIDPPYHWACRTNAVPVLASDIKGEFKDESAKLNEIYNAWLRRNP